MNKLVVLVGIIVVAGAAWYWYQGGSSAPQEVSNQESEYELDGYITTATVLPIRDLLGATPEQGITSPQGADVPEIPETRRFVYDFKGNLVSSQEANTSTFFYKQFPGGPVTYSEVFANTERWPADIHVQYPDGEQTVLRNSEYEHNAMYGPLYTSRGTWVIPSYKFVEGDGGAYEALYLEEQDRAGNVLWGWQSDDYFSVDTESSHQEIRSWWIGNEVDDYFHFNSITETQDGNYLVSAKNINSVLKVNREDGSVMFTFGGANSDFTFDSPESRFYNQHSAHELENGNILLFDNGASIDSEPFTSRVAEYEIDYDTMTATLVWEHDAERAIGAAGSVERLPDGNTLIGWGIEFNDLPNVQVVSPENEVLLSINLPDNTPIFSAHYTPELPLDAQE